MRDLARASRARANLLASTGADDFEPHDPEAPGGVLVLGLDDGHTASRIAILERIEGLGRRVRGSLIAAAPHRGLLLIAASDDAVSVARLAETASREFASSPRRISPAVYRVEAGAMQPLAGLSDPALDALLRESATQFLGSEYAMQREDLEADPSLDVYVAMLSGLEREGRLFSWSTWTRDVLTWLPEVDLVALNDPAGSPMLVPLATLRAIAPDALELVPDLFPPRWETRAWPSGSALERLRAHGLPIGPAREA